MNKRIAYFRELCFILIVLLFSEGTSFAQDVKILKNEKVVLATDRVCYVAGGKILFSAFNCSSSELRELDWSKVFYLELVSADNTPFSQEKFKFSGNGSKGELHIPSNIPSGMYYLKGYTRWMRNFSTEEYAWKVLKILNPESTAVINGNIDCKYKEEDRSEIQITGVDKLLPRQNFNFEILFSNLKDSIVRATVAVVRKGTNLTVDCPETSQIQKTESVLSEFPEYLPETRGLSLNGRVFDISTKQPVSKSIMFVSELLRNPNMYCAVSDDSGQFHIPVVGNGLSKEFFISAIKDGLPCAFEVENNFCSRPINKPAMRFTLTEEENDIFRKIVVANNILHLYSHDNKLKPQTGKENSAQMFYGQTKILVDLDKYVKLPDLEEVFKELIPSVSVAHRRKISEFIVFGEFGERFIFPPLVLVDQVPIMDVESILNIKPSKIKTIEVKNVLYKRSDVLFGGIISLTSRNEDMAGVELPEESQFFEFETLKSEKGIKTLSINSNIPNQPFYDNTLFWNPNLIIDQSNKINCQFEVGDEYGDFEVLVTAVTANGKLIRKSKSISILRKDKE